YNEIHFIDARADTVKMGFVQVGMMNTQADIVFKEPIRDQLSTLIEELTDASAQKNTLYFQLRKFSFSEQTGTSSEMGVFRFRAGLYRKLNDQFIKLNYVDTVILMKAGAFGDVTKSLMQHAGTEIIQFVQVSLRQEGAISDAYSLTEIENPDSVEKSKIKLYTTTQYTDGLYRSYKAFAAQIPDQTMIVVEEKNNKIRSVKIADSSGKIILVKAREAYAIVYKGQPYVATSYDFYPLSRKKEDFYFTGKIKTGVDPVAGVMFGVMGSLLSNSYYTFEMKIDHISGGFIRIRYIPNPE
ncbi:MAG TPA: hypothetical protein VK622_16185, partial [Puia sp.]|nr:hypothetical protein [Puia sp.]